MRFIFFLILVTIHCSLYNTPKRRNCINICKQRQIICISINNNRLSQSGEANPLLLSTASCINTIYASCLQQCETKYPRDNLEEN